MYRTLIEATVDRNTVRCGSLFGCAVSMSVEEGIVVVGLRSGKELIVNSTFLSAEVNSVELGICSLGLNVSAGYLF